MGVMVIARVRRAAFFTRKGANSTQAGEVPALHDFANPNVFTQSAQIHRWNEKLVADNELLKAAALWTMLIDTIQNFHGQGRRHGRLDWFW